MLILLSDTRKKLLWLWIGFTAVLIALVFVQTIAGKFDGIEATAWVWAFAHILPSLGLLFVAVLMNKNPSKVLVRATFRAVYAGTLAYLLLLTFTLLALPFATLNWSIEEYFAKSYTWLMPFQAILLLSFSFLYFRKEPLFRPNAAIMQEYVAKKAEFAQRSGHVSQVQAFGLLISDGGLGAVFEHLRERLKTDTNEVLVLQGQYANWQKQRDLNLLPPDALQRELNRMTMAVIDYVEKLP